MALRSPNYQQILLNYNHNLTCLMAMFHGVYTWLRLCQVH